MLTDEERKVSATTIRKIISYDLQKLLLEDDQLANLLHIILW